MSKTGSPQPPSEALIKTMKLVRDTLWTYNRPPEGEDEQVRYDCAHRLNDAIKTALVPPHSPGEP